VQNPDMTTEHITVSVDRPAETVYAYAADPAHLVEWAAGLVDAPPALVDGRWVSDSPTGRVTIDFAPRNDFGVLDHHVTMPTGETTYNPMRVLADGERCEVVFTLRRRPGVGDDEFAADLAAVRADLETLRDVMQSR
jgi:hypothetical protein